MIGGRLRASLHHLFTGNNVFVSARKVVIPLNSAQSKGFESLKQPFHTSTNDDDDFSELGLPMENGGGILLQTEKRDPLRIGSTEKKNQGSSCKKDSCPNKKDVSPKLGNSTSTSRDLENNNDKSSNFRTSSSVTIKNVPSIIDLPQLEEAISVFGKVSKAFKRSVPNGLDCCDIEFKTIKSCKTALSSGCLTIENFNLAICPLQSLETVTIRLSNISSATAYSAIHSTCASCGPLEGLVRTKEDVVVALFSVKGEEDTKSIIKRLNSAVIDESNWSAHLHDSEAPFVEMTDNADPEDDLGLQISERMADLKSEIVLSSICIEDLEYLHHSLLHLENHARDRSASSE